MAGALSVRQANILALIVPAGLLAGAYVGQYAFGLYPCEMCWWQRYPHFVAVALAAIGFVASPRQLWVSLAAVAILVSGLIGAFHAGVEYRWWEGLTACSGTVGSAGGDPLEAIFAKPLVQCDQVQWELAGISLAGWNFLFSTLGALAIFVLLAKGGPNRKGPKDKGLPDAQ
ncbi:putative oxidoreductase [Caenibius tardaugens NBRC 16725]|uniref:Putative oxidoreductase n=1 Tax=Caenibius tardaugens NBRC 16725 TaxID=1219035 RepID=U2ZUC1_9SPHN|nr:disulfide bond formation protein B [Caenibius tardaugens]AZI35970.1 disulfide bond formation protein B [Caenibius tardaugens NBRC 16725]GAD48974.1 putative oxidoreductase [Caenibius tardaugens NBRC 16725]